VFESTVMEMEIDSHDDHLEAENNVLIVYLYSGNLQAFTKNHASIRFHERVDESMVIVVIAKPI